MQIYIHAIFIAEHNIRVTANRLQTKSMAAFGSGKSETCSNSLLRSPIVSVVCSASWHCSGMFTVCSKLCIRSSIVPRTRNRWTVVGLQQNTHFVPQVKLSLPVTTQVWRQQLCSVMLHDAILTNSALALHRPKLVTCWASADMICSHLPTAVQPQPGVLMSVSLCLFAKSK